MGFHHSPFSIAILYHSPLSILSFNAFWQSYVILGFVNAFWNAKHHLYNFQLTSSKHLGGKLQLSPPRSGNPESTPSFKDYYGVSIGKDMGLHLVAGGREWEGGKVEEQETWASRDWVGGNWESVFSNSFKDKYKYLAKDK